MMRTFSDSHILPAEAGSHPKKIASRDVGNRRREIVVRRTGHD